MATKIKNFKKLISLFILLLISLLIGIVGKLFLNKTDMPIANAQSCWTAPGAAGSGVGGTGSEAAGAAGGSGGGSSESCTDSCESESCCC